MMRTFGNLSKHAVAALCLALLIGVVPSAFAQSVRIDSGTESQKEFGFYFETRLEPGTPPLDGFSGHTQSEPGVIHRLLLDGTQKMYIGYDVLIAPAGEPNTYRLTFQKLTLTPWMANQYFGGAWASIPTPGWDVPAPRTIKAGDVVALTLLTNKSTRQRVVEYITVQEPPGPFNRGFNGSTPQREFSFEPGTSRDFQASDVEMSIESPRLSINGKLDETTAKRFDSMSGSLVWFYTQKRGRFVLSLAPHPELGFRRAGEVRGTSLSFTVGSDTFTLSTGGRIAPGQAPFNLYVLHQPEWRPTIEFADLSVFIMGKVEAAELRARKK